MLKQFDLAIAELDRYERIDRPAFHKWFHGTFGPELTDIRRLQEETRSLAILLDHIEELRLTTGTSRYDAYCLAVDMRDHPDKYARSRESDSRRDDGQEEAERGESDDADAAEEGMSEEDLRGLFEEVFGHVAGASSMDPASDEYRKAFSLFKSFFGWEHGGDQEGFEGYYEDVFGEREKRRPAARDSAPEARAIYRRLAKKLHPDNREGAGSSLDELWFQVQAAYERGDVRELQTLEAGHTVRNPKGFAGLPVSHILAVHEQYERQLRLLRSRRRDLKSQPDWRFTGKAEGELEQLRAAYSRVIASERDQAEVHKILLEARLQACSRPPTARAKKKMQAVEERQLSLFDL